jgi:flagellar hook-associated protein 1 FlgK
VSTFSGLGTALSALYAQRRGMDVTSQNIANANTDGYSRQRAELRAAAGTMQAAMHARADPAGNGVTVESVTRLRDTFLEARGRIERGNNQYIGAQQQIYGAIEQIVGEPSDTGLQAQLNEFWSGWEDLASRPGDEAVRTQLLRRGGAVAATLSNMHSQLSTLWDVSREQAGALTIEINSNARQVAELNDAVVKAHHVGMPFHEFADQRDRLVQRLSELTGAVAVERKDGSVDVTIAGSSLVNGGRFRQLRDAGGTQLANPAVAVQLEWTDTPGVPTAIPSGRLGGMLEALNGTLPATAARLDDVGEHARDHGQRCARRRLRPGRGGGRRLLHRRRRRQRPGRDHQPARDRGGQHP